MIIIDTSSPFFKGFCDMLNHQTDINLSLSIYLSIYIYIYIYIYILKFSWIGLVKMHLANSNNVHSRVSRFHVNHSRCFKNFTLQLFVHNLFLAWRKHSWKRTSSNMTVFRISNITLLQITLWILTDDV